MAEKKSFFERRTEAEIRDLSTLSKTDHQKDLVERIDALDPESDGLIIDLSSGLIIPERFFRRGMKMEDASRKAYKHGNLIPLEQPRTLEGTYALHKIPLDMREEAFRKLGKIKQQNNKFIGYSCWPVFGTDNQKRVFRFREIDEGAKLFSYGENFSVYKDKDGVEKSGIKVEIYGDVKRAIKEGAWAVSHVPSRSKKQGKYRFGLFHVPYMPNPPSEGKNYNLASVFSLKPVVLKTETGEPVLGRTTWEDYQARFPKKETREGSDVVFLDHLDVCAYLATIKECLANRHNQTPLQFNPYALPSKHRAEFYYKLENNVLAFDSTLDSKQKLRHLHLAEISILDSRGIGVFGHDDFAYWEPVRDGLYKNYSWKGKK
jgi:hypothetical protein